MSEIITQTFGEFFTKRLAECKISYEDTVVSLMAPEEEHPTGGEVWKAIPYLCEDADGNIIIRPYTLDKHLRQRQVKKSQSKAGGHKIETFQLVRLQNPTGDRKYNHPAKGFGSMPFIPWPVLQAFHKGETINTLIITEGYFKAIRAAQSGIDCIGLSGITLISDKESDEGKLYPDIIRIIQACEVKSVIILWDADCRDISTKALSENSDIRKRPQGFISAACNINARLRDYPVSVYFSYVKSNQYPNAKGLDDILNAAAEADNEQEVVTDLLKFDGDQIHFRRIDINRGAENKLATEFLLHDVNAFYNHNRAKIGEMPFVWGKEVMQYDEESESVESKYVPGLPKGVDVLFFLRFNFYIAASRYWTLKKEKGAGVTRQRLTNFTMQVKYLIRNDAGGKRIVILKHESGRQEQVELSVGALSSVTEFKKIVESQGPFNCTGLGQYELDCIKEQLFSQEKECKIISYLGQQKDGFWAWSNGIYAAGEFYPANEYGIVTYDDTHYYIPYAVGDDDGQYQEERMFCYRDTQMNFAQWSKIYVDAYGDNGKIAVAFAIAGIFVDIVVKAIRQFPMLFFFGKRGTGKTTAALSLMYLFGYPQKELSLEGKSTSKAMTRILARWAGGMQLYDEFKENLDKDIIGTLKGFADRTGYKRATIASQTSTDTIPVRSVALIAGQHLPSEPALFSRIILLKFLKDTFSSEGASAFQKLRDAEDAGISGVIHDLLNLRAVFAEEFPGKLSEWFKHLRGAYPDVTERQLKFWGALLATSDVIGGYKQGENGPGRYTRIALPYSLYGELLPLVEVNLSDQTSIMESANEVKGFFEVFVWLIQKRLIMAEREYKVVKESEDSILLYIRMTSVYGYYLEGHRQMHNKTGIGKAALFEYLKSEKTCLGTKDNMRFRELGSPTSAYVFDVCRIAVSYNLPLDEYVFEKEEESQSATY
jgi:hypothetical protein